MEYSLDYGVPNERKNEWENETQKELTITLMAEKLARNGKARRFVGWL